MTHWSSAAGPVEDLIGTEDVRKRLIKELNLSVTEGSVGRLTGASGWLVLIYTEPFTGKMITEFEGETITWLLSPPERLANDWLNKN